MLQAIRSQIGSWVVKALLALLIVAFAIWGINDVFFGERDPTVAEVGDIKIPRSALERDVTNEINRMRQIFGARVDTDAAFRRAITASVLDRLINQAALQLAARDFGVTISDSLVSREIRSDPSFTTRDGQFDRNLFFETLFQARLSEQAYVEAVRSDLAIRQFDGLLGRALPVPEAMSRPVIRHSSETRSFDWLTIPYPRAGTIVPPDDATLRAFYREHQDAFMVPEMRDITLLHLDPEAMAADIHISESQLREAFAAYQDQFQVPERRQVSQALFASETAALAGAAAARAGGSLALARDEDGTRARYAELGWVETMDLLPELVEPVFSASQGSVVGPIQTSLGWHVISVTGIREGERPDFEAVQGEIRQSLGEIEAVETIFAIVDRLEDSLAAGISLTETAANLNLATRRIETIDRRGLSVDGTQVARIPPTPEFLRLAFTLDEGETSPLTETDTGGFFVLRVNRALPPAPRPFADVEEDVRAAWIAEQQERMARESADQIIERLKGGEPLAEIASTLNLNLRPAMTLSRQSPPAADGPPAALIRRLFALRVGEAASASGPDGVTVGVLSDIGTVSAEVRRQLESEIVEELRDSLAGDLFEQMLAAFRDRTTVRIRPAALQGDG